MGSGKLRASYRFIYYYHLNILRTLLQNNGIRSGQAAVLAVVKCSCARRSTARFTSSAPAYTSYSVLQFTGRARHALPSLGTAAMREGKGGCGRGARAGAEALLVGSLRVNWSRGAWRGQAVPHHARLSAEPRGAVQLLHAARHGTNQSPAVVWFGWSARPAPENNRVSVLAARTH